MTITENYCSIHDIFACPFAHDGDDGDRRAVILRRHSTCEIRTERVTGKSAHGPGTGRPTVLTYDTAHEGEFDGMGAGRAIAIGADVDTGRAAFRHRGETGEGVTVLYVRGGYRLTVARGVTDVFTVSLWHGEDLVLCQETGPLVVRRVAG